MLSPADVTACLVTRGDQDMRPILDSLIFETVLVWDNSARWDFMTAGRYVAVAEATTPVVYFQDDDVLVPRETQEALLAAYEPGVPTAVYAHGENPGGYDDVLLVGAGALVDRLMVMDTSNRYLLQHPLDDGFLYDCDFALGVLYPIFKQVRLPFTILPAATDPSRLCNQPWQADLKRTVTERARAIRDNTAVAA